jgi:hypothetical protein
LDSKIKPQKRKPNGDWIYPAKENKRKQRLTSNSKKKKWYATPNLTCKCTGLALSLGYRGLDADHRFFFPPSAGRRMVAASALSAGPAQAEGWVETAAKPDIFPSARQEIRPSTASPLGNAGAGAPRPKSHGGVREDSAGARPTRSEPPAVIAQPLLRPRKTLTERSVAVGRGKRKTLRICTSANPKLDGPVSAQLGERNSKQFFFRDHYLIIDVLSLFKFEPTR